MGFKDESEEGATLVAAAEVNDAVIEMKHNRQQMMIGLHTEDFILLFSLAEIQISAGGFLMVIRCTYFSSMIVSLLYICIRYT